MPLFYQMSTAETELWNVFNHSVSLVLSTLYTKSLI